MYGYKKCTILNRQLNTNYMVCTNKSNKAYCNELTKYKSLFEKMPKYTDAQVIHGALADNDLANNEVFEIIDSLVLP